MKISELSRQSGVPLATIKFYLRERLLSPGEASGPNQAEYGPEHLRRLALIRTLKDVGGLSIAALKRVIAAVEAPDIAIGEALETGIDALSDRPAPEPMSEPEAQARRRTELELAAYLGAHGWDIRPGAAAFEALVDAVLAVRRVLDPGFAIAGLEGYLKATDAIAAGEIAHTAEALKSGATEALQAAIAGTVLFEPILLSLRRLAHEHHTHRLLNGH
jgi:DNA-binding transcriptional MerR regulator